MSLRQPRRLSRRGALWCPGRRIKTFLASPATTPPRRHLHDSHPPPPPPLPTIPTCPAPTCACAPTPAMPAHLPIDGAGKLNGLITAYAQQVLVCTGRDDWPSRIEEEQDGANLAAALKALMGRGGPYSDPFHNVSVLNSSFAPSAAPSSSSYSSSDSSDSVYLLPSFQHITLPRTSAPPSEDATLHALVRGYLLPPKLHPLQDESLPPGDRARLTRSPEHRTSTLLAARPVADVLVLICGHGGRDLRCGLMGPALRAEFEAQLPRAGFDVLRDPPPVATDMNTAVEEGATQAQTKTARVGLISHIGGHKFAGNVIVYLPPGLRRATDDDGETAHPLAGHGVWYGRVEPRHVEGLVRETVGKGNVVADMFRGAIRPSGDIVRL